MGAKIRVYRPFFRNDKKYAGKPKESILHIEKIFYAIVSIKILKSIILYPLQYHPFLQLHSNSVHRHRRWKRKMNLSVVHIGMNYLFQEE